MNSVARRFIFAGKELNDELDLNWYDVSARNYDPALGRWMNIDPLAEQGRRNSPFNFGFNNPVYFQDYDGMWPSGTNPIKWLKKKYSQVKTAVKEKVSNFLEKNDIIFEVESSTSLKVGLGGKLKLGNNSDLTVDGKLIEAELISFKGDLTEKNSLEYDHIGKDKETKIKMGVEVSMNVEGTKHILIDAHNNFTSKTNESNSHNYIIDHDADFDWLTKAKVESSLESDSHEDFSQSGKDSNGNSISNKSSSKTKATVSATSSNNGENTVSFGFAGGAFLNAKLNFRIGFKPKQNENNEETD